MQEHAPDEEPGDSRSYISSNSDRASFSRYELKDIDFVLGVIDLNRPTSAYIDILCLSAAIGAIKEARQNRPVEFKIVGDVLFGNLFREAGLIPKPKPRRDHLSAEAKNIFKSLLTSEEDLASMLPPPNSSYAVYFGPTSSGPIAPYMARARLIDSELCGVLSPISGSRFFDLLKVMAVPKQRLILIDSESYPSGLYEALGPNLSQHQKLLLEEADRAHLNLEPSELGGKLRELLQAVSEYSGFCGAHIKDREIYESVQIIPDLIGSLSESELFSPISEELLKVARASVDNAAFEITRLPSPQEGVVICGEEYFRNENPLRAGAFRRIIKESPSIRFALRHEEDSRPTSLTREQGEALFARLESGESSRKLLLELDPTLSMEEKASSFTLFRGPDDRITEFLRGLVEKSKYESDPLGRYSFVKHPSSVDLEAMFKRIGVPLLDHATFWLLDFKSAPKRTNFSFKAEHLETVLNELAKT